MRSVLGLILQGLYTVSVTGLALYGFHAIWLLFTLWRTQGKNWGQRNHQVGMTGQSPHSTLELPVTWPKVTVQLPVYNERHVVERLMDACANLNYPADKLQIQVLDDSTDQTTAIIERRIEYWQARGIQIEAVRRVDRRGYKAGALAHALPLANGEFVAIFDADFAPPSDFLQRTLPYFAGSGTTLGFVQARWGHLNSDYSPLTRSQALALDGHFVVEQAGRQAAGYPFGFNGSAGVWRRACIEDQAVGGWQTDTLCEDLDLSYRAQLAGWQPCYLNDLEAPAEIPVQLIAFKRQQARWAQGSIQTLRKMGRHVWQSQWSLEARLAAIFHLGSYLIHPLLLVLLLVTLPLMLLDVDPAPHLALLSLLSFGPPVLYAVAQIQLHPGDWWKRWSYLPVLTLLGTGICLKNSIAVWQGLSQNGGQFLRTPKFRVEATGDRWQQSNYRLAIEAVTVGELILMLYALVTVITALVQDRWWTALFPLIYAGGFGVMIFVALWQARPIKTSPPEAYRRRSEPPLLPVEPEFPRRS